MRDLCLTARKLVFIKFTPPRKAVIIQIQILVILRSCLETQDFAKFTHQLRNIPAFLFANNLLLFEVGK